MTRRRRRMTHPRRNGSFRGDSGTNVTYRKTYNSFLLILTRRRTLPPIRRVTTINDTRRMRRRHRNPRPRYKQGCRMFQPTSGLTHCQIRLHLHTRAINVMRGRRISNTRPMGRATRRARRHLFSITFCRCASGSRRRARRPRSRANVRLFRPHHAIFRHAYRSIYRQRNGRYRDSKSGHFGPIPFSLFYYYRVQFSLLKGNVLFLHARVPRMGDRCGRHYRCSGRFHLVPREICPCLTRRVRATGSLGQYPRRSGNDSYRASINPPHEGTRLFNRSGRQTSGTSSPRRRYRQVVLTRRCVVMTRRRRRMKDPRRRRRFRRYSSAHITHRKTNNSIILLAARRRPLPPISRITSILYARRMRCRGRRPGARQNKRCRVFKANCSFAHREIRFQLHTRAINGVRRRGFRPTYPRRRATRRSPRYLTHVSFNRCTSGRRHRACHTRSGNQVIRGNLTRRVLRSGRRPIPRERNGRCRRREDSNFPPVTPFNNEEYCVYYFDNHCIDLFRVPLVCI